MKPSSSNSLYKKQKGAVLLVALVMILLMTLIGVSAMRGSNLQEMMIGNFRDKQVSFQAAEAALREAESTLGGVTIPPTTGAGIHDELAKGSSADYWKADFDWSGTNSKVIPITLSVVRQQPVYVIEKLDVAYIPGSDGRAVDVIGVQSAPEIMIYRVTTRGVGLSDSSFTYLQTLFRRQ